jgi:predicted DNA-binding transcriptional regulator AlpA
MSPKRSLSVQDVARKRLLSVEDAARYLGLSPRTVYNGIAPKSKDPFPVQPKRYGRRRLFDIRDLDAFADSLSVEK